MIIGTVSVSWFFVGLALVLAGAFIAYVVIAQLLPWWTGKKGK